MGHKEKLQMKSKRMIWLGMALIVYGITFTPRSNARLQNPAVYQQMNQGERAAFVSVQARRIAKEISGREYNFTPAFEAAIQNRIEFLREADQQRQHPAWQKRRAADFRARSKASANSE
jgi:hypothetical protein